jgi:dihydrofolate synthase/folylpolyglutamate synthase
LPEYLEANLRLAVAALKVAGIGFSAEWFDAVALFGRMSRISENVTIDVGHNPLAAEAICRSIYPKKVVLVYNTYRDKEYDTILEILKPVIKRVEIIEVDESRIVERKALEAALESKEIAYAPFTGTEAEESYLVFGSFSVVEAFLKEYHA